MLKTAEFQAFGQGSRRWPFLALLVSVFLLGSLSWLYSRVMPSYIDQIWGTSRFTATTRMMYNPFGNNYTFERAVEIFDCTSHSTMKPIITFLPSNESSPLQRKCPSYFHWIEKDLAPWKETGVTQAMMEKAREHTGFRAVIVDGKLYIERVLICFETRAMFTVWGILLLLRKFEGQIPDLELVFNCGDNPRFPKSENSEAALFGYDSNSDHYDIPFPDWSFWGWSELMIDNWDEEREKIANGSKRIDWNLKVPRAYWTGNPYVGAPHRVELLHCNGATKTEIHTRNWGEEIPRGKQNSKLEDQCTHRYMIYTEGNGWSVSLKYILACGSPTLAIAPAYYDFFSRGLLPWVHFIPVRPSALRAPELCEAVDQQVDSCEADTAMATRVGEAGLNFMRNEVSLENVYDYMFHLLSEYAKLQKFRPAVPDPKFLITLDHMLCQVSPKEKHFLQRAMEVMPVGSIPCYMPKAPVDGFKEADWVVKMW